MERPHTPVENRVDWILGILLALAAGAVTMAASPEATSPFGYTYLIAQSFLDGHLGLVGEAPSWMNEMIPWGDRTYAVFPLGSVLSALPFAILDRSGIWTLPTFPSRWVAGGLTACWALLLWAVFSKQPLSRDKRTLLVLGLTLGTWNGCNLIMAGSWHLNLGWSVVGQTLAILCTWIISAPFWAGVGFALAFGHRTELILLAPIFLLAWWRPGRNRQRFALVRFCLVPFLLGVGTLAYNAARFGGPLDFGYSHIPGVLAEPWYKHGIFSWRAIPTNFKHMLWMWPKTISTFPFVTPSGFGGSIFLYAPILVLVFRAPRRRGDLWLLAWGAIFLLTASLWTHGNPGGWQFSYRYAAILLPWAALLLATNSPPETRRGEVFLLTVSLAIQAWAIWLFHWTRYVVP